MAALLRTVPSDLVERIALHIEYSALQRMASELPALQDLLVSDAYWARQVLVAEDHRDLVHRVLRDPHTQLAAKLKLDGAAGVDDVDLSWIAGHCRRLTHVTIRNCRAVTDKGIAAIVAQHGQTLVSLDLSAMPQLSDSVLGVVGSHCSVLQSITLSKCSFTMHGVRSLFSAKAGLQLKAINLSRCYYLDCAQLSLVLNDETTPNLRVIDLSHMDTLQPQHMRAIAVACRKSLRVIIVKDCTEVTLRAVRDTVRAVKSASPRARKLFRIEHNAYLEDHTIDGVRRFLLGLVNV